MLNKLFSKRNKSVDQISYVVGPRIRKRIITHLSTSCDDLRLEEICHGLFERICKEYGELTVSGRLSRYEGNRGIVLNHASNCSDEQFLDFLEMFFSSNSVLSDNNIISEINNVFREEGVGYSLTKFDYDESIVDSKSYRYGLGSYQESKDRIVSYPMIIKTSETIIQQDIVEPSLDALSGKKFKVPKTDMMKAYKEFREGKFSDCITSCCTALEGFLKVVCEIKKIPFSSKDACATMIDHCSTSGLFETCHKAAMTGVPSIRNALGDAHSNGIKLRAATENEARHMLCLVASHVTYVKNLI